MFVCVCLTRVGSESNLFFFKKIYDAVFIILASLWSVDLFVVSFKENNDYRVLF